MVFIYHVQQLAHLLVCMHQDLYLTPQELELAVYYHHGPFHVLYLSHVHLLYFLHQHLYLWKETYILFNYVYTVSDDTVLEIASSN